MTTSAAAADLPLLNMVAIVTVASESIGRSIALHLAGFGARIAVNYTACSAAHADSLAAEINAAQPSLPSPRAVALGCDVSDSAQVTALFDAAEGSFDAQPHILVTSAGGHDGTHSVVAGKFLCMQEAAKRLKRGGGGRVVVVLLSPAAYPASKAAVGALAKELWRTGITVNGVGPGMAATEMNFAGKSEEDVRKAVESKDFASVVGSLATDSGEWVSGVII